jgi:hypothetical protein
MDAFRELLFIDIYDVSSLGNWYISAHLVLVTVSLQYNVGQSRPLLLSSGLGWYTYVSKRFRVITGSNLQPWPYKSNVPTTGPSRDRCICRDICYAHYTISIAMPRRMGLCRHTYTHHEVVLQGKMLQTDEHIVKINFITEICIHVHACFGNEHIVCTVYVMVRKQIWKHIDLSMA